MVVQTMYSETFVLKEKTMNKIKILIDPSFMGERFKMACFRKGEV